MQNLEPADLSWVNHLQERDSSKEVTMSDHSKRISFKLKYTADKKKKNDTGKEYVVQKEA